MLNVNSLKAEMVRNGYTQEMLAKALGMSSKTFYNRMKNGDFGRIEMEMMIELLSLNDPMDIFFAK